MPVTVSAVFPLLLIVSVRFDVLPACTLPNARLPLSPMIRVGLRVQFAYNVCGPERLTGVPEVICAPVPLVLVHHPANVYPVRVVVAKVPYVAPFVTVIVVKLGVVPLCASNVTR